MNVSKIKIASFCVYKKLMGYDLVKNPKNTPYTFVQMNKKRQGINWDTDTFEHTKTITKDYSKNPTKQIKERSSVYTYSFYDKKGNKVDEKKDIEYWKKDSDSKEIYHSHKERVDESEIQNRDLSGIHKERCVGKHQEINPLYTAIGPVFQEVNTYRTKADKIIDKFFLNERNVEAKKPNFFITLINNLRQK